MIEVFDEILEGKPVYDVSDSNGNLIHSGVIIEMTTPQKQAPTPLNKALFDKITSRLLLISKYNSPNVTTEGNNNNLNIPLPLDVYDQKQLVKMQLVPQDYLSFSNGVFPTTSGNGFQLSSANAFNGNGLTNKTGSDDIEASIECPIAIIPKTFEVRATLGAGGSYAGVEIYASNNGVDWDLLVDEANIEYNNGNTATYTYETTNTKPYCYYKIKLSWSRGSSYVFKLNKFDVKVGEKSEYNSSYSTQLAIGELSSKPIDGVIRANVKYTLCNEGNKWVIDAEEAVNI